MPNANANANAKLKLIKTLWGIDEPISPSLFKSIKAEGYDGVEVIRLAWALSNDSKETLIAAANEAGLAIVCQMHTCGGYLSEDYEYAYCDSYSVSKHKEDFKSQLRQCVGILEQVDAVGGFVNVHAGVDAWTLDQATDFLTFALQEISKVNVVVTFETHRQRLFCNPFMTRDLLQRSELADLKLNADLSHWYCACERVFDFKQARDEPWWPGLLQSVADRCHYIHARFGWAQGPQMADPSAPECESERNLQTLAWKVLLQTMIARDGDCFVSPEYGPPPYLPVLPGTQEPVASLPGAVAYTKVQLEELFAKIISSGK
jgi:sugar phosphate isomerase/epimerase